MISYPKNHYLISNKSTTVVKQGLNTSSIIEPSQQVTKLQKENSKIFMMKPNTSNSNTTSNSHNIVNSGVNNASKYKNINNNNSNNNNNNNNNNYNNNYNYNNKNARVKEEANSYAKLNYMKQEKRYSGDNNQNDFSKISNNSFLDISSDVILPASKKDISSTLKTYKNFLKTNLDKIIQAPSRTKGIGIPRTNSDLNKTMDNKSKHLEDTSFMQKEKSFIASSKRGITKEPSFKMQKQNSMKKNSKIIDIFQKNHNAKLSSNESNINYK